MEARRWSAVPVHVVPTRLAELGVAQAILAQAVDAGLHAAAGCTALHPINYAGIVTWGEAVYSLRDQLVPKGWAVGDMRGLPTVVHPSGTHQIAVAGGTRETGRRDRIPRTRRPKGVVTELAVADNQISLDPTGEILGTNYAEPVPQTWFVLHYADPVADEVRLELSLPGTMHRGQVTGWLERIPLEPIRGTRDVPLEPAPDVPIEIDITPRQETS
jgi:hypothetical protein